jgi:hypothetical protein
MRENSEPVGRALIKPCSPSIQGFCLVKVRQPARSFSQEL